MISNVCSLKGQVYSISQEVKVSQGFPYGMDKDYVDVVNPSGILRSWIWSSTASNGGRAGVVHYLSMTLIFHSDQLSTSQKMGLDNIEIPEGFGMKTNNNINAIGKEIAFVFSKAPTADWTFMHSADRMRYWNRYRI